MKMNCYHIVTDTYPENLHDFGFWQGPKDLDEAIQAAWLAECESKGESPQDFSYGLGLSSHDTGFIERLTQLGLVKVKAKPVKLQLDSD